MTERIDAHQHFWRLSRGDYGWLTPELGPLWRDCEPSDAEPFMRARGIGRCVAHELAHLGAHVVLVGRKAEKLEATAGEIIEDGGSASWQAFSAALALPAGSQVASSSSTLSSFSFIVLSSAASSAALSSGSWPGSLAPAQALPPTASGGSSTAGAGALSASSWAAVCSLQGSFASAANLLGVQAPLLPPSSLSSISS